MARTRETEESPFQVHDAPGREEGQSQGRPSVSLRVRGALKKWGPLSPQENGCDFLFLSLVIAESSS